MSYKLLIMNGLKSLDFWSFSFFFGPVIRDITLNPALLNNSYLTIHNSIPQPTAASGSGENEKPVD